MYVQIFLLKLNDVIIKQENYYKLTKYLYCLRDY